jgi:hypothetical protein
MTTLKNKQLLKEIILSKDWEKYRNDLWVIMMKNLSRINAKLLKETK